MKDILETVKDVVDNAPAEVKEGTEKKVVKVIKVDPTKCIGCRACELACSAFHATPKYSSNNPARSRIVVVLDEFKNIYVPIGATYYTPAECNGRNIYTIEETEYKECNFCGASCPARDYFKEPDSGLPLKCDMCEDDPPLEEPMCVQVCRVEALTYEEREEDIEEDVSPDELELGLESLADKYGLQQVMESVARMKMDME